MATVDKCYTENLTHLFKQVNLIAEKVIHFLPIFPLREVLSNNLHENKNSDNSNNNVCAVLK